jgi:hypothetical protein
MRSHSGEEEKEKWKKLWRWTTDILGELPPEGFQQYVQLCIAILNVDQDPEQQDQFTWPCDSSGVFSAKATYDRLFEGGVRFEAAEGIWQPWAPYKCKKNQWLAVQDRLWTTERRARHGLQATTNACYFCLQQINSVDHILLQCSYAKEVWFLSMRDANLPDVTPSSEDQIGEWWLTLRQQVETRQRRAFDARVMLRCWSLWKQRNTRIFRNMEQQCSARALVIRIKDELALWNLARITTSGVGGSTIRLRE